MTDLRNMKVDELKDIARDFGLVGAWKMTKDKLIELIIINADRNGQSGKYFDSTAEVETEEEVEETTEEELETEEEPTDEEEVEEAEEEEPKAVKKPSLKIKELTFEGRTQTIKEWAAELEMPWPTLYDRINRNGWTVEEALTIPLGGRRSK